MQPGVVARNDFVTYPRVDSRQPIEGAAIGQGESVDPDATQVIPRITDDMSAPPDTTSEPADIPAEPTAEEIAISERISVNAHLDEIDGEESYEDDAGYWSAVADDFVEDLKEAMPAGTDLSKLIAKVGELRELGHKLIAESVSTPPAVQVQAGGIEPVTVGLFTDDDGEIFLSVPEIQIEAGLVKIVGGRAGRIHNGWRLIYGA